MQRGRAAGGAPAAGAPGKQPKWKRTVMEWEMLPGGEAVLETSLDAFIEAHGKKVAAGVLCSLPAHSCRPPPRHCCVPSHLIRQGLYTEGEVAGFV